MLLPAERRKALTGLANTEPVAGASHPRGPGAAMVPLRVAPGPGRSTTVAWRCCAPTRPPRPDARGVLVIDEHGDRKWGKHTAHVGRQYLANLGKTENGVVSVTSLWADERVYWPVGYEPYTPAHHFAQGKADPEFRTKLATRQRVAGVAVGPPFRAVVADSFYGEDDGFRQGLGGLGVGYVLALKPSHTWWHEAGTIGARGRPRGGRLAGRGARGGGARWCARSATGTRTWWALEVEAGPYGPLRAQRAVVATTDPATLPDRDLVPEHEPAGAGRTAGRAQTGAARRRPGRGGAALRAADVGGAELQADQVRAGLEQYQVRTDTAIRRHWQLVCCAFSFCWWAYGRLPTTEEIGPTMRIDDPRRPCRREGEKGSPGVLAETLRAVRGWLEPRLMPGRYWRASVDAAADGAKSAA